MKLHFESDLPYQAAAIKAVCDLFKGQEVCRSEFTVTTQAVNSAVQDSLEGMQETDQGGIGNRLTLLDDEIAGNLADVRSCATVCRLRPSFPVTSPWRWKPARAKPTCIYALYSS